MKEEHFKLLDKIVYHTALELHLRIPDSSFDDLYQEGWESTIKAYNTYSFGCRIKLSTWIKNKSRCGMIDYLRKYNRLGLSGMGKNSYPLYNSQSDDTISNDLNIFKIHSNVIDSIKSLSELYKTTIIDTYIKGMKASEIAERDNISIFAVYKRRRRAYKKLRELLKR